MRAGADRARELCQAGAHVIHPRRPLIVRLDRGYIGPGLVDERELSARALRLADLAGAR